MKKDFILKRATEYRNYALNLILNIFAIITFIVALIDSYLGAYSDAFLEYILTFTTLILLFLNKKYNIFLITALSFFWLIAAIAFALVYQHQFDTTIIFLLLTPIIAFLILPRKIAIITIIIYELLVAFTLYYGYTHYTDRTIEVFTLNPLMNFVVGTLYLLLFWVFYHTYIEQTLEDLEKLNKEKNLLFNELQHRVKNNFNLLLSLLKIQQQYGKYDKEKFIQAFTNRVESMVIAHNLLFMSENIDTISLKEYIEKIVNKVLDNSPKKVQLISNIYDINLSIQNAIYLGIIINELITNSLKYAQNKKSDLVITILFKKVSSKDALYLLEYFDNGSSMVIYNEGFGIKMIRMAVKQLGGKISISTNYKYKITLKEHL